MDVPGPKKIMAGAGLEVPRGEEPSAVLAAPGECEVEMDEIVATGTPTPIPISCPAGFDYEATIRSCALTVNTNGGANPGGANPGNSGGGSPTGGEGETALRTVEFTLSCSTATRGSSGTCSVSAPGEELGTLEFAWSFAAGGSVAKTLGKSSWSGTAVSDVKVNGTAGAPARNWTPWPLSLARSAADPDPD
jgi:hypothetical protein